MCYDWVDQPEKMEYIGLPPRNEFFNKLKGENIDEKTYLHAENVYREFSCANFGAYLKIYLIMVRFLYYQSKLKTYALIMFI